MVLDGVGLQEFETYPAWVGNEEERDRYVLQDEFVLLAVILDACSRRVIGWTLERTLEDELTLAALRMALSQRTIQVGMVHHSDRGSQYASQDYTDPLKGHGIKVSMSQKGNPWNKLFAEPRKHVFQRIGLNGE